MSLTTAHTHAFRPLLQPQQAKTAEAGKPAEEGQQAEPKAPPFWEPEGYRLVSRRPRPLMNGALGTE